MALGLAPLPYLRSIAWRMYQPDAGTPDSGTGGGAPQLVGLTPTEGPLEGGTTVLITGSNFEAGAKVYFGSRQGTIVRFASDSELIVEAPGGKPNETVDVLVIFEPGGQLKIKDGFTFVETNDEAPSVDDLTKKPKK